MSDREKKGLPCPDDALPKSDGLGNEPEVITRAANPVKRSVAKGDKEQLARFEQSWHRMITGCGGRLRKRYGPFEPETVNRMARTFRASLAPRKTAGRKPKDETVRAAELYVRGLLAYRLNPNPPSIRKFQRTLWRTIYQSVIPGVLQMHKSDRMYYTNGLRRNVTAWLNRRGDIKLPLPRPSGKRRGKDDQASTRGDSSKAHDLAQ